MTTTARAAVYGRESQARARSIDDQIELGIEACQANNWDIAGVYDDGASASRFATRPRPGWDRLKNDLETGRFDILVLWEASRGSRELIEWATLLETCMTAGVLIHFVGDDRTYDPRRSSDYEALANAGVRAVGETARLSERAQRGINRAVKQGRPPMGKPPYGYQRIYDPKTGELIGQEPDPQTAHTIRYLFNAAAAGHTLAAIGRELGWRRQLVHDRLRNPQYAGLRRHRRQGRNGDGKGQLHPAEWEPIIPPALFFEVQEVLNTHQGVGGRPSRFRHLLSGLAECGVCHDRMTVHRGEPDGNYTHYRCHQGCVSIRKHGLEQFVTAATLEALASPTVYRALRQQHERTSQEAQQARDDAATLTARLEQARDRYAAGVIDIDDYTAVAARLKTGIAAANRRAEQAALPPTVRQFAEAGADVDARWNAAPLRARRDVIKSLMRVVVHPVGRNPHVPISERVELVPLGSARTSRT